MSHPTSLTLAAATQTGAGGTDTPTADLAGVAVR
jgi:hypothetical protein